MNWIALVCRCVLAAALMAIFQTTTWSASPPARQKDPVAPVANPCVRPAAGSVVENPPALFSRGGVLSVDFSYQTRTDAEGRSLFCFMTPDGLENPTLHVQPGDHLQINITNNTPATPVEMQVDPPNCGASAITGSSVSLHFHGTNTSPTCHQDEVLHTVINSGETFAYDVLIPRDEPPGLYWYHSHIHMHVEPTLLGGASGVIVVDGIQNFVPALAGMPQRILVVRDQEILSAPPSGGSAPSLDITLNNIPIAYPQLTPAVIQMATGERQLWRVSNSSAAEILDLQVRYDGAPQGLQIVALDGVPTGSQDGTRQGTPIRATHVLIPTAGRAEFIVQGPAASVGTAALVTRAVDTGPDGDSDPERTLATIQTASAETASARASAAQTASSTAADNAVPSQVGPAWKQRFENLAQAPVAAQRTLYFSENNPLGQFFITVEGATPRLFNPNDPPTIVATQGTVEEWTVENRTLENHEFHTHQNHFLVLSQDNFEVNGTRADPRIEGQFLDTVQVPYWDGNPTHPFPSVTLRMDFRGLDIGDFVYHCHIAEHEDNGMMSIIRVIPAPPTATSKPTVSRRTAR
jgi:FtsP/CotA-like multicopper oxidase with cupredoxin domain